MIVININEKCNGCGICAKKCPTSVFEVQNKKSVVKNEEDCMACKLCEVVCPMKGINVIEY